MTHTSIKKYSTKWSLQGFPVMCEENNAMRWDLAYLPTILEQYRSSITIEPLWYALILSAFTCGLSISSGVRPVAYTDLYHKNRFAWYEDSILTHRLCSAMTLRHSKSLFGIHDLSIPYLALGQHTRKFVQFYLRRRLFGDWMSVGWSLVIFTLGGWVSYIWTFAMITSWKRWVR
jgi:hypothetical protein